MKILSFVAILVLSISSAFARDFLPPSHMENIPLANSSIQQCYVFETTPGVAYTVEVSNNLTNWTSQDEIYGFGGEYVVPMREFTPPPPPPPGTPPAVCLPRAKNISLRLQRASGAAAGSVVSWPSLDHGGPVVVRIDGNMDPGWSQIPIFTERFGNFYFFFWHPTQVVAPPVQNSILGINDSAMLAVLEASLPAMNQQVADSTARVRNAPPPAPPDPDSKRFWRVKVDWSLDTDHDGSPDWAEFEIAARGTGMLVPGVTGDPFNADNNNDGIPDGEQLDADLDGYPDAKDPDKGGQGNAQDGALVTWTRPVGFQFAAFELPILTPDATRRIDDLSDNGSVLFTTYVETAPDTRLLVDTTLHAHSFPYVGPVLGAPIGYYGSNARSLIGDQMLGERVISKPGFNNGVSEECLWDPVADTYAEHAIPGYHDDILDDRLGFRVDRIQVPYPNHLKTQIGALAGSLRWALARLEGNHNVISGSDGGTDYYWRYQPQSSNYGAAMDLPEASITRSATIVRQVPSLQAGLPPTTATWNLVPTLDGLLIATDEGEFSTSKVTCKLGQHNVGVCSQGWLATDQEIWSYDRWTPLTRYFGNKHPFSAEMCEVLDTGLAVAVLNFADIDLHISSKTCLLFPISAEAEIPAVTPPLGASPQVSQPLGVDNISMMAREGAGRVDEIWIMAPNGGASTPVIFRSPANADSTLKLTSDDKVMFTPEILDSPLQTILVSGKKTDTDDAPTSITRPGANNAQAIGFPVKVKVMKKRTVEVALHKVYGRDVHGIQTSPTWFPTKAELEVYLNKVYGRQINTFFNVTIFEEKGSTQTGIDFDLTHDHKLQLLPANDERTAATPNPKVGTLNSPSNIDVWVIGGGVMLIHNDDGILDQYAFGLTDTSTGTVVVDGSLTVPAGKVRAVAAGKEGAHVIYVIAHEIGHVMTKDEHPGAKDYHSGLEWEGGKDPFLRKRLMCSSDDLEVANPGALLIKREWDRIEAWLKSEEVRLGRSL